MSTNNNIHDGVKTNVCSLLPPVQDYMLGRHL